MKEVRVFAPASVSNLNCGFDALGFALDGLGDEMILRKKLEPGVKIAKITGADLPYDATENVAGVAVQAMLDTLKPGYGISIEIHKGIRPGSGLGSSAASSCGAVFGVNMLMGGTLTNKEMVHYAMIGEALASGGTHADNVAPCLYGGITLISGYSPLTITALPIPGTMYTAVWHPHLEIKTKQAREILPDQVPMRDAIVQTANLGGLVASLYENDMDLFARSCRDVLIEPHRKNLIPGFDGIRSNVMEAGAIGFGISGSGPAMFAFFLQKDKAQNILDAGLRVLESKGIATDTYQSQISNTGCRIIA